MVAHYVRDVGAAGSNPVIPTKRRVTPLWCYSSFYDQRRWQDLNLKEARSVKKTVRWTVFSERVAQAGTVPLARSPSRADCKARRILSSRPRQSKLHTACSDFFISKSERTHSVALPFSQKVTLGSSVRLQAPSQATHCRYQLFVSGIMPCYAKKIIRPLPCFSLFPQKQAFAGALKSYAFRHGSFFLSSKVMAGFEPQGGTERQENSPVDCF